MGGSYSDALCDQEILVVGNRLFMIKTIDYGIFRSRSSDDKDPSPCRNSVCKEISTLSKEASRKGKLAASASRTSTFFQPLSQLSCARGQAWPAPTTCPWSPTNSRKCGKFRPVPQARSRTQSPGLRPRARRAAYPLGNVRPCVGL